jgi:hypothetical protein
MAPDDSGVSSGRSRTIPSESDSSSAKSLPNAALTDANNIWLEQVLLRPEKKNNPLQEVKRQRPLQKASRTSNRAKSEREPDEV